MADYQAKKESKIKVVYNIEDVFQEAAKDLVTYRDWKFLGRRLGLEERDLQELISLYDRDGRRETIYQMLRLWRQKTGREASLPKLSRYLREEQLPGTADIVSSYQVREECTRCTGTGHRRCSHDRIPSHITRSKTSSNLKRTKVVTNYPVLPNIKNITPRVDSGMRTRQRTLSASSSTCSTPQPALTPLRSLSVDSASVSPEPGSFKSHLPPIVPKLETADLNPASDERVAAVEEHKQNVPVEEHEQNVPIEVPQQDQSVEVPEQNTSIEAPEQNTSIEAPEQKTPLETPEPEPEVLTPEPTDHDIIDFLQTAQTEPVPAVNHSVELVTETNTTEEEVNSQNREADNTEDDKKTERGVESEPAPEPVEKITVPATVNVTEIRPLPRSSLNGITVPSSIADLFKTISTHYYTTIVKDKDDHAKALEGILQIRDFLVANITIGSIKLELECYSRESYETLRRVYRNGTFTRACEAVFNVEEVLRQCGLQSVRLAVEMEEFDNLAYTKEETTTEVCVELEGKNQSVEVNDIAEKKKKNTRRKSNDIEVTVDVKASFQAQVQLDLTGSSAGSSSLDDKLRLGKARTFHKLISSPELHDQVIETMNSNNLSKNLKYKSIVPRGDRADLTVTCSSDQAIKSFYDFFLKRELKRLLEKTLLTRSILRRAELDDVKIDVDISTDHIARCEKKFAENLVKAKGSRYD